MTEQLFDVFLAHNSVDKLQVRAIATKLRERGLKPWLDEEQIPAGKSFQEEIQKAIPQVKAAAIIIGTTGLGKWQIHELHSLMRQLVNRDIPVIPVLLVGVDKIPDNLVFLQEFNWVSFEKIDDTEALDKLQKGITQIKSESSESDALTNWVTAIIIAVIIAVPIVVMIAVFVSFGWGRSVFGLVFWLSILIFIVLFLFAWFAWEMLMGETACLNRGVVKSNLGDHEGAIADYNKALQIKPDYADAYCNRGSAKSNLGDKQGAIADYNQAIQIKPDYAIAYSNRGSAKDDLGDKQGAIADYNQAIQIKPDYAIAYYNRGVVKSNLGDKQGAIADYNQAAQLYSQQGNMEMYREALNNIKKS